MRNDERVQEKSKNLIIISILISLPQIPALLWGIKKKSWVPLIVCTVARIPVGILLLKHYHRDVAFICSNCDAMFQPSFKDFLFTQNKPDQTRTLTCLECGVTCSCIETSL